MGQVSSYGLLLNVLLWSGHLGRIFSNYTGIKMRKRYFNAIVFLLALVLCAPSVVSAAELKVLDEMGLTRAVKRINNGATVVAQVGNGNAAEAARLSHVDGLAPDISGTRQADGSFVFSGVTEGTWRLVVNGSDVVVSRVRIE